MKNITHLILEYRKAKSILWNSFFRKHVKNLTECSPLDEFEEIDSYLFRGLVEKACGADKSTSTIIVLPKQGSAIRVMLGERDGLNVSWGEWTQIDNVTHLKYVALFDWDEYGNVKYQYCKCELHQEEAVSLALADIDEIDFFVVSRSVDGSDVRTSTNHNP